MKQTNSFYLRLFTWFLLTLIFLISIRFPKYFNILIIFVLTEILIFEWKNFFKITDVKFRLIMPFYPILPFFLILILNTKPYRFLLILSFILGFSFDTGAYIIGKLWGKHKICPKISPSKTWQGTIGGCLFNILVIKIIFLFLGKKFSIFVFGFTLICSILAFLGDLFESYLKRHAGIKDSGNLLPGHGGFLDRFDSILFVITFCYVFRNFLINFFKALV